jgi:hypothetical protein
MGVFHRNQQNARQQSKERNLSCFTAALPLQNTTSLPYLQSTAYQVEMHPCLSGSLIKEYSYYIIEAFICEPVNSDRAAEFLWAEIFLFRDLLSRD